MEKEKNKVRLVTVWKMLTGENCSVLLSVFEYMEWEQQKVPTVPKLPASSLVEADEGHHEP